MKKARFSIQISGETNFRDDEKHALDLKSRVEAIFIPYLYGSQEFNVDGINVSVHVYDDGSTKVIQAPEIRDLNKVTLDEEAK